MKLVFSGVSALVLLIACSTKSAVAQGYVIYTVAGGAPAPTPAPAIASSINPNGLAADSSGNVYFSDFNHAVYKTDPSGVLTRIAGTARPGFSGDGGSALSAQLHSPQAIAVDSAGNVYIADSSNGRIRKVSTNGIISTVAGSTQFNGFSGDGGPAIDAVIGGPSGVAVDNAGNLYIADSVNLRIREVTTDGVIQTIAGNGGQGYSGDGGQAVQASIGVPVALCVDGAGDVYFSVGGTDLNRVRKVSSDGIITTVAGTGPSGASGVGGAAVNAQLFSPRGVAADHAGNIFIADIERIIEVSPSGILTLIAGGGTQGYAGDGGPATSN
jgi:sugar lactone lactonase YvrE